MIESIRSTGANRRLAKLMAKGIRTIETTT